MLGSIVDTPPPSAAGRAERARRSRPTLVGVVAVAVVVGFVHWRSSASAFEERQHAPTIIGSAAVGEPFHFGVSVPPSPEVRVTSADLVVHGGVPATTTVVVCEPRSGAPFLGSSQGELSEYCAATRPAEGADLGAVGDGSYLVATVVPLGVGEIEVRGVRIDFEAGFRSGTDHTGAYLRLDVTG